MKILLIITDYGSFNNFLSELALKLLSTGHEVHVICSPDKVIKLHDKHPYKKLGVQFHHIQFPRSFNLLRQIKASKEINRKIEEIDPYLINIHFTTGIFTTVIWRKPKYTTIGTIHGVGYPMIKDRLRRAIFRAVEKFCFKRLDQIYVLNQSDYNIVKQLYPAKAFIYESSGVGYDIKKFDPKKVSFEAKAMLRHHLNLSDKDFVLTFTGRFVVFKGFDIVVKTFRSLIEDFGFKNIKLLIIGGEDSAHKTGLTLDDNKFYRSSPFITHVGFTPDVNLYLSISNLFLFPSVKEGMPVCIMEALAMGVPVITSNSRGCNDLIEHGYNGYLLSENPIVSELREAVLKLYNNRLLLQRMSANALASSAEHSREEYVSNQMDIYQENLSAVGY